MAIEHRIRRKDNMVLGDGIRRNISSVDPLLERAALIRAFKGINSRHFPSHRSDLTAVEGVT